MVINSEFVIQSCFALGIKAICSFNGNVDDIYSEFLKLLEKDSEMVSICKKTSFSMFGDAKTARIIRDNKAKHVIIIGRRNVTETVIDFVNNGYIVHACIDCLDIMDEKNRDLLCDRLLSMGANITTAQSVMYQLLKDENHAKFKSMVLILEQ